MEITQFLSQVWIYNPRAGGRATGKDIQTGSISINHTTTVRGLRSSVKIIATHILSGKGRDHKHRRSAYGVSLATIICLPMFSNGIPLRFNVTRILQGREREGTDHFPPQLSFLLSLSTRVSARGINI